MVEHVAGEVDLAGAAHDVAQIEAGRPQRHLGVADPVDGRRGHEREATADSDDEPAHRRVHLPVRPARHDVFEAADVLSLLVAHRTPQQSGKRHDGVEDACLREDAARAAPSLVRQAVGIAVPPRQQPGPVGGVRRRWRCHGGTSSAVVGRIGRIGQPDACEARPAVQQPAPVSRAVPTARTPRRSRPATGRWISPGGGGRCAGGTTGGFAPLHGHTSFAFAPCRGIGPFGRNDPTRRPAFRAGGERRRPQAGTGTVDRMDLTYPPEAEAFRAEIAGWLKDNLPDGWGNPGSP